MLSQTAEYALRAVVWLAEHEGESLTTQQVAERASIPAGYLSRVLNMLGRHGLLHAQRGPSGGFRLTRPAASMTVLDVVNAVDPIRRIRQCPLGRADHSHALCPLHRRIDDTAAMVEENFANTTIAALLTPAHAADGKSTARPPLCSVGIGTTDRP